MTSSERQLIEQRLREQLELLSAPASIQINYLHGVDSASLPVDELAEDFHQWMQGYVSEFDYEVLPILQAIDKLLEEHSGHENAAKWTEEALISDPMWSEIRDLSRKALITLPNVLVNKTILKRFDTPDEIREFPKGKFEIVHVGGMTIGRATYQPGWKWSEDVGRAMGQDFCTVERLGVVVSGCATAAMKDGEIKEMRAGDIFYVPSHPHDSWVVGDEPYVSLHFLGADKYSTEKN